MANFDSGVKDYIRTTAIVNVNFPIDFRDNAHIACIHCPFLSSNMRMCQLNKEPVAFPEKYVGDNCPLEEIGKGGVIYGSFAEIERRATYFTCTEKSV